jgi:hypothetical protein
MNLASIKEKLTPYIEKAKDASQKALVFTEQQVQNTPIFLKNEEEYNIHITAKYAIVVAYDETHEVAHTVRMLMPIWSTQAWTDMAKLRYISTKKSGELTQSLWYTSPFSLRVFSLGNEVARFDDITLAQAWWKNRTYTSGEKLAQTVSDTKQNPADPLA